MSPCRTAGRFSSAILPKTASTRSGMEWMCRTGPENLPFVERRIQRQGRSLEIAAQVQVTPMWAPKYDNNENLARVLQNRVEIDVGLTDW